MGSLFWYESVRRILSFNSLFQPLVRPYLPSRVQLIIMLNFFYLSFFGTAEFLQFAYYVLQICFKKINNKTIL